MVHAKREELRRSAEDALARLERATARLDLITRSTGPKREVYLDEGGNGRQSVTEIQFPISSRPRVAR